MKQTQTQAAQAGRTDPAVDHAPPADAREAARDRCSSDRCLSDRGKGA